MTTSQEVQDAIDAFELLEGQPGSVSVPVEANIYQSLLDLINANFVSEISCDYGITAPILLTFTPQLITGLVPGVTPVGISESAGRITVSEGGKFEVLLERIYENKDNNPADKVFVYIVINKNSDPTPVFERTAPISSATANDEPAILPFTTPALVDITAGDYFEISVAAIDGGATPQDTSLIRLNIVVNKINNLPA